ncbi:MAG: YjbQ family protein [Anaerolineae bacterium]|nr:YjbQ family protein [Anaerolineae bacterium]NIN93966.1 YjbQ family protein [Anaerolineae bacterium]NIQ76999.1 YjbQ family protein [Anaerolineae bacterium]
MQDREGDAVTEIRVSTKSRTELVDITREVQKAVAESGVQDGICHIYVPHTTAGVTINENADPSVREDILMELNKTIPFQDNYKHREGNAAAHIKATIVGSSETVPVEGGRLALGTWQGVFFCEFDGPRSRRVLTKVA